MTDNQEIQMWQAKQREFAENECSTTLELRPNNTVRMTVITPYKAITFDSRDDVEIAFVDVEEKINER